MSVQIQNMSIEPVGLPAPFRGILLGGQSIVLTGTAALVSAALGGRLGKLKLTDVPDQTEDAAFRGDFNNLVSTLGLDGTAPVNVVLKAAGHPAGLYGWAIYIRRRAAAATGNIIPIINFDDPSQGATTASRTPGFTLVLGSGLGFALVGPMLPIWSSGLADIATDLTFTTTGTPIVDVHQTITRLG